MANKLRPSLTALGDHVFSAVKRCGGAVVLLHHRGGGRSSLWVNQEIAMLAYRQFLQDEEIPLLVFREQDVRVEGTMSELIVNPEPLADHSTVLAAVKSWLGSRFNEHVGYNSQFTRKWQELTDPDRLILRAVIEEGRVNVTEASVRRWLRDNAGKEKAAASALLRERRLGLQQKNLLTLSGGIEGDTMSLHHGNAALIVSAAQAL